jgi:mRNA-degrading endonuclease RelE of RelBE toxin-antitoxin system
MLAVKIHKSALKELNSLPTNVRSKILNACKSVANDPFEGDVKPLTRLSGCLENALVITELHLV